MKRKYNQNFEMTMCFLALKKFPTGHSVPRPSLRSYKNMVKNDIKWPKIRNITVILN